MSADYERPEVSDYDGWQVLVSAAVAVVVTGLLVWWVSGFGDFYESLFRVAPTVERGVGADWVAGNTIPSLDFLIAFVHAMDVLLGVFVLFLVFVHWAAFRRLADRMRGPGGRDERTAVADGGDVESAGGDRP